MQSTSPTESKLERNNQKKILDETKRIRSKENVRLKRCNLERNGFGPEEGRTIGDCIRQNGALEEFNISWNRLSTINAFGIAEGLQVNDSLQVLKVK